MGISSRGYFFDEEYVLRPERIVRMVQFCIKQNESVAMRLPSLPMVLSYLLHPSICIRLQQHQDCFEVTNKIEGSKRLILR